MPTTIQDLGRAGHTCARPDSTEHVWELSAAWVDRGLRAGRRVLYFEDETADLLLDRLHDDRVPVVSALDDGQLVIVPTQQTRDVARVPLSEAEQVMRVAIAESEQLGWSGTNFLGETARGRLATGLDMLVSYEKLMDRVLAEFPDASRLCLYDREYFDDSTVEAVRVEHESELIGRPVYDDGQLRLTELERTGLRVAGEIDRSNCGALRRSTRRVADGMVRHGSAGPDIGLDVMSLRFLDVAGTMELLEAAQDLPGPHRLVLNGVRPRVQRVFERCGAAAVHKIVLVPRSPMPGTST